MADTTTDNFMLVKPGIASSGWGAKRNVHLDYLDSILLEIHSMSQLSVISKTIAAPPGTPADRDIYIIASGATGAWAGLDDRVAVWSEKAGAWAILMPADGWFAWVKSSGVLYIYSASGWAVDSAYVHFSVTGNPHNSTAADVGAVPSVAVGVAGGIASLDSSAKVPASQLPAISASAGNIDSLRVINGGDGSPLVDSIGGFDVSVTYDQVKDFIHAGPNVYPSYDIWTGNHNYQGRAVFGPTANDAKHSFAISSVATFLTNPGGTDAQATGGPLAVQLIVEGAIASGEYFAMGVIGTITASSEDNLDPLKPFNLCEYGMIYSPAANGGLESTLLEARGVDFDFNIQSGRISTIHGSTARCRYTGTAIVDRFVGHKTVGPNQSATSGTLTDYVGFQASWEHRTGAAGSIAGDFIGLQVDAHEEVHPNMAVTGEQIGIWLNGTTDVNGDKGVPLVLGVDRGSKIYRSAVFGSLLGLTIETDALFLKDTGANFIKNVDAGAVAPVPVLGRLPAGAASNAPQKWIKIFIKSSAYYIPAFSHN